MTFGLRRNNQRMEEQVKAQGLQPASRKSGALTGGRSGMFGSGKHPERTWRPRQTLRTSRCMSGSSGRREKGRKGQSVVRRNLRSIYM